MLSHKAKKEEQVYSNVTTTRRPSREVEVIEKEEEVLTPKVEEPQTRVQKNQVPDVLDDDDDDDGEFDIPPFLKNKNY